MVFSSFFFFFTYLVSTLCCSSTEPILTLKPHTWCTHEPTHRHTYHYPTHLAAHTPMPTHTHIEEGLQYEHVNVLAVARVTEGSCSAQSYSPGTERKLSSALTAVVLQHCSFLLSSHSSFSSFLCSQSCKHHLHF